MKDKNKNKEAPQSEPSPSAVMMVYIVSSSQLAQLFGVTMRTIQNWKREKAMPSVGRDRYDLAAVILWYIDWQVAERVPSGSDEKRLAKAQADEREYKAMMIRLNYRKKAGELIERDQAQREMLEKIIACKTALRGLSLVLAGEVAGLTNSHEIESIVEREVHHCLLRFAGDIKDFDRATEAFVDAVAGAVAKSVAKLKKTETIEAKIKQILGDDPWRLIGSDELTPVLPPKKLKHKKVAHE